jgi:probable H4MPT-linked C1 transfer pathway protein
VTSSSLQNAVGIDVGGANLKYADSKGSAASRSFPLWRYPQRLADSLAEDLARFGEIDSLLVTMTGELADCFADRAIGVDHIVSHVCRAAQSVAARDVAFYGVDGEFRDAERARRDIDLVAAANWHALASFVASEIAADATLVDIGSTTTDVIPISGGQVASDAKTDHDRLVEGSLVYVGCRRTPVCALVDRLQFRGHKAGVMNEVFATVDDARIVLGLVDAAPGDCDTADGQPRTAQCAATRLARMIGLDRRSVTTSDAQALALQIVAAARQRIGCSLAKLADPRNPIVLSGHGSDLLDLAAASLPTNQPVLQLADHVGVATARSAPAYALARLYLAKVASV